MSLFVHVSLVISVVHQIVDLNVSYMLTVPWTRLALPIAVVIHVQEHAVTMQDVRLLIIARFVAA